MTYELAKQIKDAGFPHEHTTHGGNDGFDEYCEDEEFLSGENICIPKLSELIEACGDEDDFTLHRIGTVWIAEKWYQPLENRPKFLKAGQHKGSTPEEAVANLWLELNKK